MYTQRGPRDISTATGARLSAAGLLDELAQRPHLQRAVYGQHGGEPAPQRRRALGDHPRVVFAAGRGRAQRAVEALRREGRADARDAWQRAEQRRAQLVPLAVAAKDILPPCHCGKRLPIARVIP